MGADPEPKDAVGDADSKGTVVNANADRPKPPNLLEVQRRMRSVGFEEIKILVR